MDFWRRSAQISRKDKIRNNIKKKKMNVTRSLLKDIKTKQLKRYGHVQRMEEGRLPKKVMKWNPPGRRKGGRPKLTWAEEIRGLMEEKGLMEEDWNDRANNFYIVLYKFYIVELLLSQMRCHVTSIICTKSYLILQFCDGGFMMACLDRNISSVTHE
jgi:hypothetical protein